MTNSNESVTTDMSLLLDLVKAAVASVNAMTSDIAVVREILGKSDDNGVNLAYSPRDWKRAIDATSDRLNSLIEPLGKVATAQGDIVALIQNIDRKIEAGNEGTIQWRVEVRQRFSHLEPLRDGVKVTKCEDCPDFDRGGTAELMRNVVPKVLDLHSFMTKWKYGFIPFIITVSSSVGIVVVKILEYIMKSAPALPPAVP